MVKHSRRLRASGLTAALLLAAVAAPRVVNAAPLFSDNTVNSLENLQTACAGTGDLGCNTNFFVLTDIDGDGDLDFVMANGGGLFAAGNPEESVVYMNDGKASFINSTTNLFDAVTAQNRQIAVGDVNGDKRLDLFQPGGYGSAPDLLWIQAAGPAFTESAATLLPANTSSSAGSVHLGDLDGDGDLDLLVADWGSGAVDVKSHLMLYLNDGKGVFAAPIVQQDTFTAGDTFPAAIPATGTDGVFGSRPTDLDLVDVDGDFDLDVLINHHDGTSRLFLNDGKAKFTDATANYPTKKGPYSYNQEACDLDEDGDLDLLIDNAGLKPDGAPDGGGTNVTQVLINDGKGVFSDQTATRIVGEPAALDGSVKCADINGDGHYDIVVGSRTNGREKLLLNNGSGVFTYVTDGFPAFTDTTIAIDVGDLNGDGKVDVVTGQGEGTITTGNTTKLRNNRVYLNVGAADTTPPAFRKLQAPPAAVVGQATVFYLAARDSATNEAGQMVTVSVPFTSNKTAATRQASVAFVGGDLFRVSIPAQVDGTVITYTPTLVDRAKLTTTSTPVVLTFGTPPVTGDGGAAGAPVTGDAGASTAGAAGSEEQPGDAGAPSQGGQPGAGSSAGGRAGSGDAAGEAGSTSEGGGAGSSSSKDDDGCGCSTVGGNGQRSATLFGLALALVGLVRRRRNQKK